MMDIRKAFQEMNNTVTHMVQKARDIAIQQKDLWQQVPYLALQADGRTGYSDQYSRAYYNGYWAVQSSARDGCYRVFVDFETGELVNALLPEKRVANDKDVWNIIPYIQELDASLVIAQLNKEIKEPIADFYNEQARKAREERINSVLKQGRITQTSFRRMGVRV